MPEIRIKLDLGGHEETLTEYFCDWPDCPNPAVEVVGAAAERRTQIVMCRVHAAELAKIKAKKRS